MRDSQKLNILVNWLGAHSLLSDGKEQKFCSDMAVDLRRIASDLETLQAANEILKSELEKWMDMGYKELEQYGPEISKPFAPRSPLDLEKREAPSDEEIEDAYRQYQIETIGFDVYEKGAFTSGAEWMRNKLTGK